MAARCASRIAPLCCVAGEISANFDGQPAPLQLWERPPGRDLLCAELPVRLMLPGAVRVSTRQNQNQSQRRSARLASQALWAGTFFPARKKARKIALFKINIKILRSGVSGLAPGGSWPLRGAGFARARSVDLVAVVRMGRNPQDEGSASISSVSRSGDRSHPP